MACYKKNAAPRRLPGAFGTYESPQEMTELLESELAREVQPVAAEEALAAAQAARAKAVEAELQLEEAKKMLGEQRLGGISVHFEAL